MPKTYSDQEKAYITKRLKEETAACLGQYGIKHTTVDELVKRVKIPKGTFYLFYRSKELLLFEVLLEMHDRIEAELSAGLSAVESQGITCEQLSDLIFGFFEMAEKNPMFKILTSGEIEILIRKLPAETVENHFMKDDDMIEKLLSVIPHSKKIDTGLYSAAFRAVFMSILHKHEIGQQYYSQSLRLLINGLVYQMML